MNVLPIGQARRRLPELVRKVAQGHPPVRIGRRGKVEAVLSAPPALAQAKRRPLRGLVTLLHDDLDAANEELLEIFRDSIAQSAIELEKRRRNPARSRASRR